MKGHPKVGASGERTFVVEVKHAIDFADDGMPPVLCTPWLIWFLEHAPREAVLPWLESGESTVGLEIEVRHLAPNPLGHTVTCTARVIHVEEARITFQSAATGGGGSKCCRGGNPLELGQDFRILAG